MALPLSWTRQDDFSGGAWPLNERTPPNAVEDCVNGLYDADGSIFKRGGGAYKSNATVGGANARIFGLFDGYVYAGLRTLFVESDGGATYVLDSDDATPVQINGGSHAYWQRWVVAGDLLFMPRTKSNRSLGVYGGSRKTASYTTGTVTLTNGSATVAGSGTSWSANADQGMVLLDSSGVYAGVVASVDSNTQITLRDAYTGGTVAGVSYSLWPNPTVLLTSVLDNANEKHLAAVANRLVIGNGSKVVFGGRYPAEPILTFGSTDYHVLPGGAKIVGMYPVRDRLLVFSTAGVFVISNMAFDLTDAQGNPQQQLSLLTPELLLWQENGLATWGNAVIVPAMDNIYLIDSVSAPAAIGNPIKKLYRSYVQSTNYTLGHATVYNGHYFLPILGPGGPRTWVDTLVCNLATGVWSRMSGYAGSSFSYAVRAPLPESSTSTQSALIGASTNRVLSLGGFFLPSATNKTEADASQHNLQVTFRTIQRKTSKDFLKKVRVRFELDDAATDNPTLTGEVATGRPGSSFTALSGSGAENVGQTPVVWQANVRGQEARVRVTTSGPSSNAVIRSVETAWRESGRQ